MRTRSSAIGQAGLATVGALGLVLALALDAHAVRMTAAVLGCLVLPGLGWARRLRLRDLGDTAALTVVLSLCSTAVVATGMAVTGRWSPAAGLAILTVVTVFGFVPVRTLVARIAVVVFGRPGSDEERRAQSSENVDVAVDVAVAEDGWKDWYADARARSDEEHRRRAAEAEAAEQDWKDWYAGVSEAEIREDRGIDRALRTGSAGGHH